MIYRVFYTETFLARVEAHVEYLRGEHVGTPTIAAWYGRLFDLLDSLDDMPKRMPVDETLTALSGTETRKLNYGDYLVFYGVDDEAHTVNMFEFMHAVQDWKK